jgi:hypothetical protein
MHVPQIVCVCYSTVNIGKCKQQVTDLLLHMITIKFWKFDDYGLTSDSLLNSQPLAVLTLQILFAWNFYFLTA